MPWRRRSWQSWVAHGTDQLLESLRRELVAAVVCLYFRSRLIGCRMASVYCLSLIVKCQVWHSWVGLFWENSYICWKSWVSFSLPKNEILALGQIVLWVLQEAGGWGESSSGISSTLPSSPASHPYVPWNPYPKGEVWSVSSAPPKPQSLPLYLREGQEWTLCPPCEQNKKYKKNTKLKNGGGLVCPRPPKKTKNK